MRARNREVLALEADFVDLLGVGIDPRLAVANDRVEPAAFGGSCHLRPVLQIRVSVRLVAGIPLGSGADVLDRVHRKEVQSHSLVGHGVDLSTYDHIRRETVGDREVGFVPYR